MIFGLGLQNWGKRNLNPILHLWLNLNKTHKHPLLLTIQWKQKSTCLCVSVPISMGEKFQLPLWILKIPDSSAFTNFLPIVQMALSLAAVLLLLLPVSSCRCALCCLQMLTGSRKRYALDSLKYHDVFTYFLFPTPVLPVSYKCLQQLNYREIEETAIGWLK